MRLLVVLVNMSALNQNNDQNLTFRTPGIDLGSSLASLMHHILNAALYFAVCALVMHIYIYIYIIQTFLSEKNLSAVGVRPQTRMLRFRYCMINILSGVVAENCIALRFSSFCRLDGTSFIHWSGTSFVR